MASERQAPVGREVVRVATTSGRVNIIAEDRNDIDVQGSATIDVVGNRTTVTSRTSKLELRVPRSSDLVVGTTSARVDVRGQAGAVSITTRSGRITVDQAESVDARSLSGSIDISTTDGPCAVRTTSGSVSVGSCHQADVATEHGRIRLEEVRGVVSAHCISGRIDIRMEVAADVIAETVTGRITLSLPRGVRPYLPSAAEATEPIPSDVDCTVRARSVTGRVDVGNR